MTERSLAGYDIATATRVAAPGHYRVGVYRAGAAIPVGTPVMVDVATSPVGVAVVTATAALDHCALGLFDGRPGSGASGAQTTITNAKDNKAAVTGDAVEVVLEGRAFARARMRATNGGTLSTTNQLSPLGCGGADGVLEIPATALPAGIHAKFVLVGAGTNTDTTTVEASAIEVYVNP